MHSSVHKRINVLAHHLRLSDTQPTAVQQGLCEAQPDDGKVITADQAAALIPDNGVLSVRHLSLYIPECRDPLLSIWPTLDSCLDCCRCLVSSVQVLLSRMLPMCACTHTLRKRQHRMTVWPALIIGMFLWCSAPRVCG